MGIIFDEQIKKAEKLSGYNKQKASRLLDDLATAYISDNFDGLDKSYYAVKTTRKMLASMGFTLSEIDDYLIEHSYITKTRINKLRTQSIFMNDSISIAPHIENIADRETEQKVNDIIIDTLKSKPKLLSALKRGVSAQYITQKLNVTNSTMLIDFYNKHKEII